MSLLATLRRLVIALVVIGLSAGSMAYTMPAAMGQTIVAADPGQDVGIPCGMIAAMHGSDGKATGEMPCNTITPDCVKKMVCLQTAALPEGGNVYVGPVTFATVSYRVIEFLRTGLTLAPELSPPLAG